jgi:hypothetical protein
MITCTLRISRCWPGFLKQWPRLFHRIRYCWLGSWRKWLTDYLHGDESIFKSFQSLRFYSRISQHLWNLKLYYRTPKTPRHGSLSRAKSIYSNLHHPNSLKSVLILSNLRLDLTNALFLSGYLTEIRYAFFFSPFVLHTLPISFSVT